MSIFNCRFLTTVQTMTEAEVVPEQLQEQCSEFIGMAKGLLCGQPYLEVLDTYDTLIQRFDALLARKKRSHRRQNRGGTATDGRNIRIHPGILFAGKNIMRKWWNIMVVSGLLGLLIPQAVGLSITRCAHSGHISLTEFPKDMDCGMSGDAGCMQHFFFKVSDFSTAAAGTQIIPPQLTAILSWPILPACSSLFAGHSSRPTSRASPPGPVSHAFLQVRD